MSIRYAILGLMSMQPLSGYDVKRLIEGTAYLYWSGNNNQIYRTLIDLHHEGFVTCEVVLQEHYPARKVYTITEAGRAALRDWLLARPELPQLRSTFLVQLAWADVLTSEELDALLGQYEEAMTNEALIARAEAARPAALAARTPREAYLWAEIAQHHAQFFTAEQAWVQRLRRELASGALLPQALPPEEVTP